MNQVIFDIETTGLDPLFSKISCICVLDIETQTIESFCGSDESLILKQFWSSVNLATLIYNFNGDSFDLPFILQRCLINNVRVSENYPRMKFIDLRKVTTAFFVSYDKSTPGKLSDWARILQIPVKTSPGKEMIEKYYEKDWEFIKAHCMEDCQITLALYNRCKSVGLI